MIMIGYFIFGFLFCLIIAFLILKFSISPRLKHQEEVNREIIELNQKKKTEVDNLIEHSHRLLQLIDEREREIKLATETKNKIEQEINSRKNKIEEEVLDYSKKMKDFKREQEEAADKSFEYYQKILNENYEKLEKEYDENVKILEESYFENQQSIINKIEEEKKELDFLKSTRKNLISAQIKEKEIKEKLDFYTVSISEADKDDIEVLNRVKHKLHSPRILSMLIWQTYFRTSFTTLCNNVLGTNKVCGIYKITNQLNNLCYVGQAVKWAGEKLFPVTAGGLRFSSF